MLEKSRSERYARKEDVAELLKILEELRVLMAGLQSGTQDAAREMGGGAKELGERLQRLRIAIRQESPGSRLATKKIVAMARRGELPGRSLSPGRTPVDSYLAGVVQKLRGIPPSPPSSFRLAPVGQRRIPPPIDEKEVRRAFEARRKRLVKKSGAPPSNRGTARERTAASAALEKNLLRQLREQQGRRFDLFGRKIGA